MQIQLPFVIVIINLCKYSRFAQDWRQKNYGDLPGRKGDRRHLRAGGGREILNAILIV